MKHIIFIRFRLRRALAGAGIFAALCLLTVAGIFLVREAAWEAAAGPHGAVPVILLDAGHGGEDGGAVGVGGLVEKDLNLAVTLKLDSFLRAMGYETIMTRTTDTDLHDSAAAGLRERKTTDIHNRFHMMEALPAGGLFVSIHMNKFGQASARGTQVFYSKNNPESIVLAESIQQSVVRLLQPENHRQVKPAGDSIYLLFNAQKPAVLVECGFISNPGEAARLQEDGYQNALAFAVGCGVLDYRR